MQLKQLYMVCRIGKYQLHAIQFLQQQENDNEESSNVSLLTDDITQMTVNYHICKEGSNQFIASTRISSSKKVSFSIILVFKPEFVRNL